MAKLPKIMLIGIIIINLLTPFVTVSAEGQVSTPPKKATEDKAQTENDAPSADSDITDLEVNQKSVKAIKTGQNGGASYQFNTETGELVFTGGTLPLADYVFEDFYWNGLDANNVKSIRFEKDGQGNPVHAANIQYLFALPNLETFDGENLNVSNVTSMVMWFNNDSKLKTVDLSSWDTSNVSDTTDMFKGTTNLWKIQLGANTKFTTSPAYEEAPAIGTTLIDNGTTFTTTAQSWQKVGSGTDHRPNGAMISTTGMWQNATTPVTYVWAQHAVDPNILEGHHGTSPWELNKTTGELIYDTGTFQDAQTVVANLELYDVDPDIVTSISFTGTVNLPANATSMFSGLDNLTTFDATNSYTDNVTNMSKMFKNSIIQTLDVSNWNVNQVNVFSEMFQNTSLSSLNVSSWGTGRTATNVIMDSMFSNTSALSNLNITNFDTKNVVAMNYMFSNTNIETLNLSTWDVSKVSTFSYMFHEAANLQSLNVSSWGTGRTATNVNMSSMFDSASALSEINFENFKTNNVINMSRMFSSTPLLTLDLSDWNVTQVANFSYMFSNTTSLTSLDLSTWGESRTATDVNMQGMFTTTTNLTQLNLNNFKTTNVKNTSYMFYGTGLTSLDLSDWSISSTATVTAMFMNTYHLWKITLGPNIKFVSTPNFTEAPAAGTTIPGTSYVTNAASWQIVGNGTEFNPQGAMVTTTQMYADRSESITYVWANQSVQPTPAINTISSLNFGTLGANNFFNGAKPVATNMTTGSVNLVDLESTTTYNVLVQQTSDWTSDGETATISKDALSISYGNSGIASGPVTFWSGTSATATKSILFNHDDTKNFNIGLNPNTVINSDLLGKQLESELTWTLSETP
ncbi:BspA family leucine-rich repeat surface protein [Leuconostoc falkenbergense]|uniref:BspA family leucine-rich repeat surface protein n=1 Tax=Leuconostoc falkenbergense TaxID=2766470 RepID=UPI0029588A35|nr:BspA family leucine-rich repeat surface protein [Leuconostoc falkenbergense]MDV8951153.1 BspA family leucine-rich repeat surface protein [Leuconostoc falkenbergense]